MEEKAGHVSLAKALCNQSYICSVMFEFNSYPLTAIKKALLKNFLQEIKCMCFIFFIKRLNFSSP